MSPSPDSAPDAAFATRAGHPVQAWRVDSEGDETHLRVWSQQRQQKDEAIVARRRERFEAEGSGVATKWWTLEGAAEGSNSVEGGTMMA